MCSRRRRKQWQAFPSRRSSSVTALAALDETAATPQTAADKGLTAQNALVRALVFSDSAGVLARCLREQLAAHIEGIRQQGVCFSALND